jgi:hypothetical protein
VAVDVLAGEPGVQRLAVRVQPDYFCCDPAGGELGDDRVECRDGQATVTSAG